MQLALRFATKHSSAQCFSVHIHLRRMWNWNWAGGQKILSFFSTRKKKNISIEKSYQFTTHYAFLIFYLIRCLSALAFSSFLFSDHFYDRRQLFIECFAWIALRCSNSDIHLCDHAKLFRRNERKKNRRGKTRETEKLKMKWKQERWNRR